MLVIDANVAMAAAVTEDTSALGLNDQELVAPHLMWSECYASLHSALWRREIDPIRGDRMRAFLASGWIAPRSPNELHDVAWQIAESFGWAKTYDAEYVALASILGCRLVTFDKRLRDGTARLGFVISPEEL